MQLLDMELVRRGGNIGGMCLMSNHTHFLIKMGAVDLGKIFQSVHTNYSAYFNKKRNTRGHVFQGRPGMKIILSEQYIGRLVVYAHMNPVRAGIVKRPEDYKWSSDALFRGKRLEWIELKSWQFPPGLDVDTHIKQYCELIEVEQEKLPEGFTYIGSKDAYDKIEKRKSGRAGRNFGEKREKRDFETIIKGICAGKEITLKMLRGSSRARKISAYRHRAMAVMYTEGYGVTTIAKYFNRTPKIVQKAHEKYKTISL